jgi:uncharacterized protein YjbJ (UPF0337 family)
MGRYKMSKEHHPINRNVFEGKWKEIQGQARERWGRLTGNDLERSEGQADQLIGRLQQKYGYAHTNSGVVIARIANKRG